LADALERRGVVTRPFPSGVRVTIGLPEENDRFLEALDGTFDAVPVVVR
jgi:histidinol-phosphate aminotransferase